MTNEHVQNSKNSYIFTLLNRVESSGSRNPHNLVCCCTTNTEGAPLKSVAESISPIAPNSPCSLHFLRSDINCDS